MILFWAVGGKRKILKNYAKDVEKICNHIVLTNSSNFYFVKGSLCLKIEEFGSQLSRASSENEEKWSSTVWLSVDCTTFAFVFK